ncbi:MAG: hypothetical protein LBH74_09465 [Nitrososphaerota archaeon]|jgi:hypothetical protein|nr:hypothetical protein [Nitrososphaerota archaeon]
MSNVESNRFKLINACPPPLKEGEYKVSITQNVSTTQTPFNNDKIFYIKGAHFSLSPEDVYAVYPPINASGNYSNSIGHITLKNKSIPWENNLSDELSSDHNSLIPWLALICLSDEENSSTTELEISEVLSTSDKSGSIFFPLKKMPLCTEKCTETCRVLDLERALFDAIMPRQNELPLLAHVKFVDLYDKRDDIISLDGYFSVVVANRFVPSKKDQLQKSTFHLVSLEGYGGLLPGSDDFKNLDKRYTKLRLVSLYSWTVFSIDEGQADFVEITTKIDKGPFALSFSLGDLPSVLTCGYVPVMHRTRLGGSTVSLYRGPLVPYVIDKKNSSEKELLSTKLTADGRIIYDPEHGLFDMSYAAAWQLGRLLALKNKSIAQALLNWRRNRKKLTHTNINTAHLKNKITAFATDNGNVLGADNTWGNDEVLQTFWMGDLLKALVEENVVAPVSKDTRGRDKNIRKPSKERT